MQSAPDVNTDFFEEGVGSQRIPAPIDDRIDGTKLDCAAPSSALHAECTFAFRLGLFRARYQRMKVTPAPLGRI
jgi:hypothetical protein